MWEIVLWDEPVSLCGLPSPSMSFPISLAPVAILYGKVQHIHC